MKKNLWKVLPALGLVTTALVSADVANAASLGQSDYEDQFGSGDLALDYATWSAFEDAYVNGERDKLSGDELTPLDLSEVTWQTGEDDVEIFFINEGAAAINSLLMSVNGGSADTTVFDPIASENSIISESQSDFTDPLLGLGQGVNLGSFDVGTVLNFFLETTPRGGGAPFLLGADPDQNPDGQLHLNVFAEGEYLILGFEDRLQGDGSDFDYNDVVFAVKGLHVPDSKPVPEPATAAALATVGLFGLVKTRGRRQLA